MVTNGWSNTMVMTGLTCDLEQWVARFLDRYEVWPITRVPAVPSTTSSVIVVSLPPLYVLCVFDPKSESGGVD